VPDEGILLADNGRSILLSDGRAQRGPTVSAGRTFVESGRLGPAADTMLRERRRLGKRGVAVVTAATRPDGGLAWGPHVILRGVYPSAFAAEGAREAEGAVRRHLAGLDLRRDGAPGLEAELRSALRRYFRRLCSDTPLLVIDVAEIDSESGPPLQ
jgi:ribonuclease J